jgi:hypothetical protein
MQGETGASDQRRQEAGRQGARAAAAAFRSIRLYSPGHAVVRKAIDQAVTTLKSFVERFGPLALSVMPGGLAIESSPHPVDDDVVSEFARALRMGFVREVRFLGSITERELSVFLHTLHLPQQQIRVGGGVSKLMREAGTDSVVVDDMGEADAVGGSAGIPALMQAIASGAEVLGAQLLAISGGEPGAAVDLLRKLDRELNFQGSPDPLAIQRIVAQALLGTTRFHRAVQLEVVRALDEPFAISLAEQWPPLMVEDLARTVGIERSAIRDVVLRALSQPHDVRSGAIPVEAVARDEIQQARTALTSTDRELRTHALRRLIDTLPTLDARKVEACLGAMEREFAMMERPEDQVSVLAELGALSRRLQNGRSELVRAALHRILTTQVRDRLTASLGQVVESGHPLDALARESPDEAMLLLLELLAEENRLHVRREIVTQLQVLARGRIHLLTAHLVDPRWYIVRNVATVLGSTADPEAVPYLRVAFAHADARVRKEALHALAQIRTPDAVSLMIQGLAHPDPETQQAAAHWLGMTGSPQAAEALIALLRASPLHEALELKRTAIRSLGRLGTLEAKAELHRIQSIGGLFTRKHVDELKSEAAKALASLREGHA